MPVLDINVSDSTRETVAALVNAVDVLAARLDAIELQIIGSLDSPLPPEELTKRLRRLREDITGGEQRRPGNAAVDAVGIQDPGMR